MKFKKLTLLAISSLLIFGNIHSNINSNNNEDKTHLKLDNPNYLSSDEYFKDIELRANTLSREELFNELQDLVSNNKIIKYSNLRDELKIVDTDQNGKIVDMYSNTSNYGPNSGSNNNKENAGWNKEHLIPKSWWGGNENGPHGEGGDMFNMYATDCYVNSRRSNYPMGETSSPTYQSNNGFSKTGPSSFQGYNGTVFEPNDIYKGNIARSYFYFALRYVTQYNSNYTNGNGNVQFNKNGTFGLTTYSTNLFLDWNKHLETNEWEIYRAEKVYSRQGNRNPFIYHPEWADYIWGGIPLDNRPIIDLDSTMSLYVGESKYLDAKIENGSGNEVLSFASSNNDVASINDKGLITAKSKGNTVITASLKFNSEIEGLITISKSCNLTVNEDILVKEIKTSKDEYILNVNQKENLNAIVLPTNASNKELTYKSNDTRIVDVSLKGELNAKNVGETTIEILNKHSNVKKIVKVRVNEEVIDPNLNQIDLNYLNLILMEGQKTKLIPILKGPEASLNIINSNEDVVSFSPTFELVALKEGDVEINFKYGNATKSCYITVLKDDNSIQDNLILETSKIKIDSKDSYRVNAIYKGEGVLKFSSSNIKIASVDNDGLIIPHKNGKVTIRVEYGNNIKECNIEINRVDLPNIDNNLGLIIGISVSVGVILLITLTILIIIFIKKKNNKNI